MTTNSYISEASSHPACASSDQAPQQYVSLTTHCTTQASTGCRLGFLHLLLPGPASSVQEVAVASMLSCFKWKNSGQPPDSYPAAHIKNDAALDLKEERESLGTQRRHWLQLDKSGEINLLEVQGLLEMPALPTLKALGSKLIWHGATGKSQGCSLRTWPPRKGRSSGGPSRKLLPVCKPCLATSGLPTPIGFSTLCRRA